MLNLGPPQRPNVEEARASTPSAPVPRFGRPAILMPDNFWSNLKQFLFEPPVKVRGDVKSDLMPMEYGAGFWENVGEFFSGRRAPKGQFNSRLSTGLVEGFGGFGTRLKELFSPTKQAPIPFAVKPVRVKEIWSKDENFGWTQVISIGFTVVIFGLITFLLILRPPPATQAN